MAINLSDLERRILAAIVERSMMSGAELFKYGGTSDYKDLANALRNLQSNKLLDVSGNIWDEKDFPYVTVGVVPSARGYVQDVLGM